MKDIHFISDITAIKTLASERRLKILQHLIEKEYAALDLARIFNIKPNVIWYDVNQLYDAGLIELIHIENIRGTCKKYYRAVARNFFIDASLGEATNNNSKLVRKLVNSEVLDWRRQKIIGINFKDIAQKIINTYLAIKENERIVISYQPMHQGLVEDLMNEISKKGAYPIPILWTKRIEYNFIKNVPLKYAGKDVISDFLIDKIDAHIIFSGEFLKESEEFKITPELQKKAEFIEQIKRDNIRKTYQTDVRYLTIDILRIDQLLELQLDYESSCEMYWKALNTNTEKLSKNCKEVEKKLLNAKYLEMKDGDYQLRINLPEKKIISIQDGKASSAGQDSELPAGMIVSLLKGADVNGRCKADFAYLFERKFENVELIIQHNRVVEIQSEKDNEILHDIFNRAKGDKDLIGSFCIGLNPELHQDIGNPYINTKIYGALSLQVGWDELETSNVDSDLVAQFYFLAKTLTLDNSVFLKKKIYIK